MTFIDTALGYGDGHSEELVGQVVRERPEDIVVATKIPPANGLWPAPDGVDPEETFPAAHVRECTERSLRNLGLDTIDVQQFHVWSDEWMGRGSWQQAIEELKAEGKIRHFGVSINDHQPANALALVASGVVDSVQVIYNVFDQSPEDELLPACAAHGVGVIVRVPFDEGALTGRVGPDTEFSIRRLRAGPGLSAQRAICDDLGVSRDELAEIALRYVLSHAAVSTVIPGMRTVRNVERNTAVSDAGGLPAEELERLK